MKKINNGQELYTVPALKGNNIIKKVRAKYGKPL